MDNTISVHIAHTVYARETLRAAIAEDRHADKIKAVYRIAKLGDFRQTYCAAIRRIQQLERSR